MSVKKKVWYRIDTVGGSRRQKISAVLVLKRAFSENKRLELSLKPSVITSMEAFWNTLSAEKDPCFLFLIIIDKKKSRPKLA